MIFLLNYNICLYLCQINDSFVKGILEEGNSDLLDITDNYNLNLIVTSSKNIYSGNPPTKKVSTEAKLIKYTSLININKNYLLAACLEDSLLTSISLNDGSFSLLINYTEINISPKLEIPETICSLSTIDDYIFIGYSRIEYYENKVNKTNIVMRFKMENNNENQFPTLNKDEAKIFIFPFSTIKTNSSRQISCHPLRLIHDMNQYSLVCIYEDLKYDETFQNLKYYYFANSINEDFDDFNHGLEDKIIYRAKKSIGFRFYKIDDSTGRFIMRKLIFDITIIPSHNSIAVYSGYLNTFSFSADMDLFDYKSNFLLSAEKTNFMNKKNIYYFRIDNLNFKTYFKFYDYKEISINKLLFYYNESNSNITVFYQSQNSIKYFSLKYIENIFEIDNINKIIEIKSNKEIELDEIDLIKDLGNVNIERITRNKSGLISTENYGIDFYELLISNNKFTPEKCYKSFNIYYFAFIEHIENDYTRIYYLNDVFIIIPICDFCNFISCKFKFPTSLTLLDNSIVLVNNEGIHFYNERFDEEYSNKAINFTLETNVKVLMGQFSNENEGYILIFIKDKFYIFDNEKNLLQDREITDSEIINTNYFDLIAYKKENNLIHFFIPFVSNQNIKIAYITLDLNDINKNLTINKTPISIFEEGEYYSPAAGISCVLMNPIESLGTTNDLLTCFCFKNSIKFYSFTLEIGEEFKEIQSLKSSHPHIESLNTGSLSISASANKNKEKILIYAVINYIPFWGTFDYNNKFSDFTLENIRENLTLVEHEQFHKNFYFTQTQEFILISEYNETGCNKFIMVFNDNCNLISKGSIDFTVDKEGCYGTNSFTVFYNGVDYIILTDGGPTSISFCKAPALEKIIHYILIDNSNYKTENFNIISSNYQTETLSTNIDNIINIYFENEDKTEIISTYIDKETPLTIFSAYIEKNHPTTIITSYIEKDESTTILSKNKETETEIPTIITTTYIERNTPISIKTTNIEIISYTYKEINLNCSTIDYINQKCQINNKNIKTN